jgi:hypothetical protein
MKKNRPVSLSSSDNLPPGSSSSEETGTHFHSTSSSDEAEVERVPNNSKITKPTRTFIKSVNKHLPEDDPSIQNPIFTFFKREVRRDKNDKVVEVFARCKVLIGGHPCGKKLAQPESSTTGPRNHLKRIHVREWNQYQAICLRRKEKAQGTKRTLDEDGDSSEGRPFKKSKTNFQPEPEIKNALGVGKFFKVQVRSKQQLRFDMAVTRYFVKCGLPFSHASQEGFHEFMEELDRKFHIKNPTTYTRAKLPLLYKQVQKAVMDAIKKDMVGTVGIAFTTDLWTSR